MTFFLKIDIPKMNYLIIQRSLFDHSRWHFISIDLGTIELDIGLSAQELTL